MASWQRTVPVDKVPPGGAKSMRVGNQTIALFRRPSGELFAVDNACPHEGYPLVQGDVKGCVLTCKWHNFKFDLRDGACLKGDENVRAYPVREMDGWIEVETTPPDPSRDVEQRLQSLASGLAEGSLGRVARDIVRLLQANVPAPRIAGEIARWDARHAEYGSTHAVAVCADVVPMLERRTDLSATLPLLNAAAMASEPNQRRAMRERPAPIDPGDDPVAAGVRVRRAIETEDAKTAEGLLLGALARGWGREQIEPWMLAACAEHFLGFGHALIYHVKVFDFLDIVGWDLAEDVLTGTLFQMLNATREDLLPPMQHVRAHLDEIETDAPPWETKKAVDHESLVEELLDGKKGAVLQRISDSLRRGVDPDRIVDDLVVAASWILLQFDPAIDADERVQDGWLFVTHTLTYSSAIRLALRRDPTGRSLRHLYFAAHFIQRSRRLTTGTERVVPAPTTPAAATDVVDAIRRGDVTSALQAAHSCLKSEDSTEALRVVLEDLTISDLGVRPIIVAHFLKTTRAGFVEHSRLAADQRALPVLAAVRLCASPLTEQSLKGMTYEAISFVAHGRLPKRLSS